MLLMIDNYDSFTFNLMQYFQELGEEIEVFRNDQISCHDISARCPEAIILSPGPCTPDKAGISLEIVETFKQEVPILGVCLGHQIIAQSLGAKVIRAKMVMHGKTSAVTHNNQKLFAGLKQPLTVTRYHSLIVDGGSLPDELLIDAWTENEAGEQDIIMGFHHSRLDLYGVQFHPEAILTEQGHDLIKNFLALIRK